MNTDRLYQINNFDSFPNIYTIYRKHIVTHKRNENNESEVLSDYWKYVPIYGHFFNSNNHFICKKIARRRIVMDNPSSNFFIIKNEELVRAYKGGLYIGKDIDDLYDIIDKLNKFKKQNEES